MDRYTQRDVLNATESLKCALQRRGIDPTGWSVHMGSHSNGVSFKLLDARGGGPFATCGFLGWTCREATIALRHYTAALDYIEYRSSM